MIKYGYNYNDGVLNVLFKKNIYYSEIVQYFNYVNTNSDLPDDLKICINVNEVKYNFDEDELESINRIFTKIQDRYGSLKQALIVNQIQGEQVEDVKECIEGLTKFGIKVFSEEKTALNWLCEKHNTLQG